MFAGKTREGTFMKGFFFFKASYFLQIDAVTQDKGFSRSFFFFQFLHWLQKCILQSEAERNIQTSWS